jgi:hypothetical protein
MFGEFLKATRPDSHTEKKEEEKTNERGQIFSLFLFAHSPTPLIRLRAKSPGNPHAKILVSCGGFF